MLPHSLNNECSCSLVIYSLASYRQAGSREGEIHLQRSCVKLFNGYAQFPQRAQTKKKATILILQRRQILKKCRLSKLQRSMFHTLSCTLCSSMQHTFVYAMISQNAAHFAYTLRTFNCLVIKRFDNKENFSRSNLLFLEVSLPGFAIILLKT